MNNDFRRVFAMLRGVKGSDRAAGFARFELKGSKGAASMTAQGLIGDESYSLLLLCPKGEKITLVGSVKAGASGQGVMNSSFSAEAFDDHNAAVLVRASTGEAVLAGIYGKHPMRPWDEIENRLREYLGIKAAEDNEPEQPTYPAVIAEEKIVDVSRELLCEEMPEEIDDAAFLTEEETHADEPVWSGYALSLYPLFEKGERHPGFDELPDITFVKARMPMDDERFYLIGAQLSLKEIQKVYIAIPGEYAQEAPPSLTGSKWYRDGSGAGFWIKCAGDE